MIWESPALMNIKYGGPEKCQSHNAHRWIEKVSDLEEATLVGLESQVPPTVLLDATNKLGFFPLYITLIVRMGKGSEA